MAKTNIRVRIIGADGNVFNLLGICRRALSRAGKIELWDEFRKEARTDFENFRKQCMDDFLSFMRNPWKAFESEAPKPKPKEDAVPPQVAPEEDRKAPADDTPVTIDGVVPPQPEVPQPEPVEPAAAEEIPVQRAAEETAAENAGPRIKTLDEIEARAKAAAERDAANGVTYEKPERRERPERDRDRRGRRDRRGKRSERGSSYEEIEEKEYTPSKPKPERVVVPRTEEEIAAKEAEAAEEAAKAAADAEAEEIKTQVHVVDDVSE